MNKRLLLSVLFCYFFIYSFSQQKDTIPKVPHKDTVIIKKDTLRRDTAKKDSSKKNDDIKPYKDVVPDSAYTRKGLFIIHKVNDSWLFEIPDSLFNRDILVVTRFDKVPGGAGAYGGEIVNQQMIRWIKGPNKNIFLQLILTISVADSTNAIYTAVQNSNANPYIAAFPIKAYGKNSVVIDVQSYLSGDNTGVSFSNNAKRAFSIGGILPDRSYIESVHTFPINTEVKTVKTFSTSPGASPSIFGGFGRSFAAANEVGLITVTFNNSFLLLPKTPMQQREFDPRVGYFADDYTKYEDEQQRVKDDRFIVRWRLEPKPEDVEKWKRGVLVEPKKQLVYYIDPATPAKWVPYLKAGINDWGKAFEKAGFKNAIIAKDWPANDTTMSLEDARFSVLRYFASDIENAYGPNVHDPRSGEILESHIGWYHNVMKLVHDWYLIQAAPNDPRARKMVFDDALMGDLIRFVSSHEIGHTLGLRHNWGSSSTVPVEMLRNKKWLDEHGHTPSIMDYARFNYVAQPEDNLTPSELYPHIGEYDRWAIQWGYSYSGGKTEKEDHEIMSKIIIDSLSKNPRLWFGTESDPYDPRCQNEDLSDDAMKASTYGILNLQRVIKGLPEWTKEPADMYDNLQEMYGQVVGQYSRYMGHVLKNIGGIYATPKSIEQSGNVYQPVLKPKQQDALAFLNTQFFTTPQWLLDTSILNKVSEPVANNTIYNMQAGLINSLAGADRLNRLVTSANQFGTDCYLPDDLLTDIENDIFKEWSDKSPIDYYRRNIQKAYINTLIRNFTGGDNTASTISGRGISIRITTDYTNTDVPALSYGHLLKLKNQLDQIANSYADPLSKYHLQQLDFLITKTLNDKN
ncbi:MAG: zinc-dependent metalloprotease [Arachidicoccus sp.]|nr:zinc-dependent metalloprotease [Arachidicoccus sp.]